MFEPHAVLQAPCHHCCSLLILSSSRGTAWLDANIHYNMICLRLDTLAPPANKSFPTYQAAYGLRQSSMHKRSTSYLDCCQAGCKGWAQHHTGPLLHRNAVVGGAERLAHIRPRHDLQHLTVGLVDVHLACARLCGCGGGGDVGGGEGGGVGVRAWPPGGRLVGKDRNGAWSACVRSTQF